MKWEAYFRDGLLARSPNCLRGDGNYLNPGPSAQSLRAWSFLATHKRRELWVERIRQVYASCGVRLLRWLPTFKESFGRRFFMAIRSSNRFKQSESKNDLENQPDLE
jgi:hypothetical protein